jgi:alginate O-acetyltransferase complex protein AlgI
MVFDSGVFLVFFALFFVLYHAAWRSLLLQNVLLLAGSYIFYGWWDWRFLALMTVSSGVDYAAALALGRVRDPTLRRAVLWTSLATNLGFLFTFKYFDFFAESLAVLMARFGVTAAFPLLHLVLPIGISFYTFQSMSYTIDVYRGQLKPERDPIKYFAFVSFFPHLVAGPIQRAGFLLGQINRERRLAPDHVREAVWLLVWGFFLKEVPANGAAQFADMAFQESQTRGWLTILGTLAFAIQIYCDFNAYSLIARGTGRLLGFELVWNFNQPYFASSIADFWRRWHISLSTWLRDYLYIPLGGSRHGTRRTYINLMATMLLGGLWHGAAWNFVAWGALHGGALAIHRAFDNDRSSRRLPAVLGRSLTLAVVLVGWWMFRCRSWPMMRAMAESLTNLAWHPDYAIIALSLALLMLPVLVIELWQYRRKELLAPLSLGTWRFACLNAALIAVTFGMWNRFQHGFIYFQF